MSGCQHEGCRCQVPEGTSFCGGYCEAHADHPADLAHACECGHPECQNT
jgi:hypothetical protein